MTYETRIQEEYQKCAGRIAELKKECEKDDELLQDLKERYLDAASNQDVAALDQVNAEIRDTSEQIQRRKDMIDSLTTNNPEVQRLAREVIDKQIKTRAVLEEKAAALHAKLLPHYKVLTEGLAELNELHQKAVSADQTVEYYKRYLNKKNLSQYGFNPLLVVSGLNLNVQYIRPLLVEGRQVYR
ncbi:hypothetical protein J31TS4_40580 [Paenibacillus sp. J31TS4]|uniref:hypothetical protein n=1 Tax=Paenibacillus sp. J31TS4 TaxID=2807195 RepID=UPI001B154319|nr:hypothetical protein [Paenibacillus sp. J31TS4]GIP40778.1 hypothetical protein J31TS4_40580 [Paenibacillus sp. J31TS4]